MTTFIIGLILGIFLGAFIANSGFRTKCINAVKWLIKKAQQEAQRRQE
jgi:hypothetical protein